jgi:hypothetical protein
MQKITHYKPTIKNSNNNGILDSWYFRTLEAMPQLRILVFSKYLYLRQELSNNPIVESSNNLLKMKSFVTLLTAICLTACNPNDRQAVGDYTAADKPGDVLSIERFGKCTLISGRDTLDGEWSTGPADSKSANVLTFDFNGQYTEAIYNNDTIEYGMAGVPRLFVKRR